MSMLLGYFVALVGRVTSDVTPNAVNWANISGGADISGASQTISGINQTITLRAEYGGGLGGLIQLYYSKNGGGWTSIAISGTFTVVNGDTIAFRSVNSSGSADSDFTTIYNDSDGGASLDTFTMTHST